MIKVILRNMTELFGSLIRKGVVIGDGKDHLIVIDEGLTERERLDVLRHEVAHIILGHLKTDCEGAERERREAEADEHLPSDAEIAAMFQAGKIQVVQE